MNTVQISVDGKNYKVSYKTETLSLSREPFEPMNVYNVFVNDPVLKKIVGDHFNFLWNPEKDEAPIVGSAPGNEEEKKVRELIAEAIVKQGAE